LLACVLRHPRLADQLVDGRHCLASPLAGANPGYSSCRNAGAQNEIAPSAAGGRSFVQRTATPSAFALSGAVLHLRSDTGCQRAAFELPESRRGWPCRLEKLTACRKSAAYVSAP